MYENNGVQKDTVEKSWVFEVKDAAIIIQSYKIHTGFVLLLPKVTQLCLVINSTVPFILYLFFYEKKTLQCC